MVEAPNVELPDWLTDLRDLRPYVDQLVDFASSPQDFILEYVLETFVNWILAGARILISSIQSALSPVVSIPASIAAPIVAGGALVTDSLVSIIATINDVIITLSSAAGPASPIVVVIIWGVIFMLVAELIRQSAQSLPLVIPWL